MAITIQSTDNEQARRFVIGQTISQRNKTYEDSTAAMSSPVASKIFGFPWTAEVSVGEEYVEVVKQDWVEWSVLEEPLKGLLAEHFAAYDGGAQIEENPEIKAPENPTATPEGQLIQELIEQQINPALSQHGGFVTLHGVKEDKVYLEMGGGCQGCAMSYQTMKEGIETAIKEAVPTVTEVVDVTNHAAGDNPFYT